MSCTTMPIDGEFNVKCLWCGHDFKKTPKKIIGEKDLHWLFCHQCKETMIIKNHVETAAIFKVIT